MDDTSPDASVVGGLGSNVEVIGNRIQLSNTHRDRPPSPSPSFTQFGRGYRHDGILHIKHDDLRSYVVLVAVSGRDLGGVVLAAVSGRDQGGVVLARFLAGTWEES